ncbi:CAAX prenyl protease-like protein [Glaciihabitans tibetensis]|uniref:CAAX prenyl protease-like protein n=1 Tax=Glaciihabitans tibetensis TaxID=1266600 RepID=A0A2T0V4E1_9MICO|nr:CPBP family intramembrane glutamic endopeptidase [Glaciihabitans tibetensis]PRY65043.1 CAAX prenyl protease-like protein [Glaciihabitans tibetensis]
MLLALLSLLILVVAVLVARAISRERREYGRFKRLRSSKARNRVYARWLRESFFVFGGLSAVILLASSQYVSPALQDARAWAPMAWALEVVTNPVGTAITTAVAVVVVLALVAPILLLRNHQDAIPTVGDVAALIPRTRSELPYGAALAINAGLVEELLFRFSIPALIFALVGNGAVAFFASALLFGMLHLYQGPAGVISSTILGLVFTVIYILSGSILLVIVIHALFDLRSLVLIPVVITKVWRKTVEKKQTH